MKKGSTVRLVQPEIRGEVVDRRITEGDEIELLVAYVDAEGQEQRRWFAEAQLEEKQP